MHDAVQNGVMLKFPLRFAGVACWGSPQTPPVFIFSLSVTEDMSHNKYHKYLVSLTLKPLAYTHPS